MKYNLDKLIELITNDEYNIPDDIIDHALNMKKELREILKYENEANKPFVSSVEIIKEILGE